MKIKAFVGCPNIALDPYFLNLFSLKPLPTFKKLWKASKELGLHGSYLLIFTVFKIRIDAFAAKTASYNYLMGL